MATALNNKTKLELGVGERPTEGYLHQDISSASGVCLDFTCPPWEISIEDSALTEVLALGVVEHLRFDEVGKTAANAFRMLGSGGCFIFDVPDMKIWSEYLYNVTHGMEEKIRARRSMFGALFMDGNAGPGTSTNQAGRAKRL